jgi:hypothetical protein
VPGFVAWEDHSSRHCAFRRSSRAPVQSTVIQ